ncbi:protein shisa-1-like [Arapaima gigas]
MPSCAALSALLLLWAAVAPQPPVAAAAAQGEYCHGWADAYNDWHQGFQCPEGFDRTESRYCCGSCTLRYCCTEPEARLDQSACDSDDGNPGEIPPQVPVYLPFLIVAGAFVTFVLVGSAVAWLCCHCLKPKLIDHQSTSAPVQQSFLLESGSSSPDSVNPSRNSTSSSAGRSMPTGRPHNICTLGSDVTVGVYGPVGGTYAITGPQVQPGPYFQPYLSYSMAPERSILVTPTYLDSCSTYGGQSAYPFPQAPVPMEQLYPAVTT